MKPFKRRWTSSEGTGAALAWAVGPFGLSAGVRHHVVFSDLCADGDENAGEAESAGEEELALIFPESGEDFRMFEYSDTESGKRPYNGESLTLGHWIGVSGAAFSTGIRVED